MKCRALSGRPSSFQDFKDNAVDKMVELYEQMLEQQKKMIEKLERLIEKK
jgi:hypothetical protein